MTKKISNIEVRGLPKDFKTEASDVINIDSGCMVLCDLACFDGRLKHDEIIRALVKKKRGGVPIMEPITKINEHQAFVIKTAYGDGTYPISVVSRKGVVQQLFVGLVSASGDMLSEIANEVVKNKKKPKKTK